MADWKSRATPVTSGASTSSWKSRAVPVKGPAEEETDFTNPMSVLRGVGKLQDYFAEKAAPANASMEQAYQKLTGASPEEAARSNALIQSAATSNIGGAGFMETPGTAAKALLEGGKNLFKGAAGKTADALDRTALAAKKQFFKGAPQKLYENLSDEALNKLQLSPLETAKSLATKTSEKLAPINAQNAEILANPQLPKRSVEAVANELTELANELGLSGKTDESNAVLSEVASIVRNAKKNGISEYTYDALENIKKGLQTSFDQLSTGANKGRQMASTVVKSRVETGIADNLGQDVAESFIANKGLQQELLPIQQAAETMAAKKPGSLEGWGDLARLPGKAIGAVVRPSMIAAGAEALAKIPRSIAGIKAALPQIMRTNPGLGMELQKAVSLNRESSIRILGPLMSQLGDQTEPSEYPSEFEGKLHSPEDVSVYKQRISKELPPRERAKAMSAVHRDGSIAAATPPPPPVRTNPDDSIEPKRTQTLSDVANRLNGIKQRAY
jgi:hypothetical protein